MAVDSSDKNGKQKDQNGDKVVNLHPDQVSEDGTVLIPDHYLSSWAANNSQDSQNHSITTAAFYAVLVPICIVIFIAFFPITTKFVSLAIEAKNFKPSHIGVEIEPGLSQNKRVIKIENKFGEDILDFVVNFHYAGTALTNIIYSPPEGIFVDVYEVGRRNLSDGSYQSSLGVKNLKADQQIIIGMTFLGSASGFKFESITSNGVGIWNSPKDFLIYRYNSIYLIVGALVVLYLIYKIVKPYYVNYRSARFIGRCFKDYLNKIDENPVDNTPVGKTLEAVYDEIQELINASKNSIDLRAIIEKHQLITREALDNPSQAEDFKRIMIGPFNIVGHPTFRKRSWFKELPFLIFHVDKNGKIIRWNKINVQRIINPIGGSVRLSHD